MKDLKPCTFEELIQQIGTICQNRFKDAPKACDCPAWSNSTSDCILLGYLPKEWEQQIREDKENEKIKNRKSS